MNDTCVFCKYRNIIISFFHKGKQLKENFISLLKANVRKRESERERVEGGRKEGIIKKQFSI